MILSSEYFITISLPLDLLEGFWDLTTGELIMNNLLYVSVKFSDWLVSLAKTCLILLSSLCFPSKGASESWPRGMYSKALEKNSQLLRRPFGHLQIHNTWYKMVWNETMLLWLSRYCVYDFHVFSWRLIRYVNLT